MRFMQIESVLQTINRSQPAKNRFSVALIVMLLPTCTSLLNCHGIITIKAANNKGADQSGQMCRLICAFVGI